MGITSLQVCMDSADWLQGAIHEDSSGMDSSSPSGDMLTCSRPLIERRLRLQQDQALKCPRCDSTHTKFCYYNNYSLSQPRYFCKTCRRYWTKGGTLRSIPVGGGCRKNKKVSKKPSNNNSNDHNSPLSNQNTPTGPSSSSSHHNPTDLHLSSFPPEVQFSHLNNILANPSSVLESKYSINGFLENPRPIDFMESKLEAIVGSASRNNYDFMGNGDHLGMINGIGEMGRNGLVQPNNFPGICSPPYGMTLDGTTTSNGTNFMETCQRLMLTYEHDNQNQNNVKPNTKLLSLDWQEQGCSDNGNDTYGYLNSMGSWSGMMNGYGPSTTKPLV